MSKELFSPIQEFECKGKIIFDSNEFDTNFLLKQMENGRLVGEFEILSASYGTLYEIFSSGKSFRLSGVDKAGLQITVDRCYLTSLRGGTKISAKFNAFESLVRPEKLKDKPKNKLVAVFALVNIDETFRVKVDTTLGKLYLRPMKGYKDKLPVIKTLGVSGITAFAEIFINNPDTSLSLKEILSDSINVVQGFLCITRLADTCHHGWCSASLYEKLFDSEKYELVLQKMTQPKTKPPSYRSLTNPAHSSYFFESAYAGYKGREDELKKVYDFDIALEWYLEANIASVLESQYLMACTCLELLVDRYAETTGTEFIMDQDRFDKDLFPFLVSASRRHMKELGMSSEQRSEIYMKLKGLNRRSIKTGIESLLAHLKVKYDDLFNDLGAITRIRNRITHTGIYDDFDELSKVFNRLYVLLTRIFLSILNYQHDYFDWSRGDWVHFRDVCER